MIMRRITIPEFHAELRAQGVSTREQLAFKCPMCGTIQSAQSLINARAGESFDKVEKYLGFSCVGRFTNAGPHKKSATPGRGCDWTLGGLLGLHSLEVIDDDGKAHPRFEIASPSEAKALQDAL
jgi:hypothetical protein